MRIPMIRGIIDRRILVNYRVDPKVLAKVCPPPFRPQTVEGVGIAGICLIRLKQIRPFFLPSWLGIESENAAHRIAVEWDTVNGVRTGVFIPRRDTSSLLNAFAGGRIFPGVHHRAKFEVRESTERLHVAMTSVDGVASVVVDGALTDRLPDDSVFSSVENCSDFFEEGSLGYSPSHSDSEFDGLELQTSNWNVEPLSVSHVESSFFNDRSTFPVGSVEFDNALLMRGIDHQWKSREPLCCAES